MNFRACVATVSFALVWGVAAMAPVGNAQGARLVVLDSQSEKMQDGRMIEDSDNVVSRASPSNIQFTSFFTVAVESPEEGEPDSRDAWGTQIAQFLIEPEDGESEGDPVCYAYQIELSVTTTVEGEAVAAAGSGGAEDIDASASNDPLAASVDVLAGTLDVTGLGEVASFGPILSSGNGSDSLELSGHFLTAIGEEISFDTGVAVAAASNVPGSASAESTHSVLIEEVDISECPPPPVPALPVPVNHWPGMLLLGFLLLLAGTLVLRRPFVS